MLATILVIILGSLAVLFSARKLEFGEIRLVFASYAMHVASGFVQVWLHYSYYEFSDMHSYIDNGRFIASLLDADFMRFAPEVAKLFLHLECDFSLIIRGEGSPTGSMSAVSGAITYLTGDSIAAVCLTVAVLASLGQLAMYKVLRDEHPSDERPHLATALLMVPSVVLWSSALAKEAIAIAFFGCLLAGSYRFAHGKRRLTSIVWMVVGGLGVGMVKPYILFPFVLAGAAWFYVSRQNQTNAKIRPLYFLLAGLFAVLGLVAISSAFPEFSTSKLAETTAMQQERGAQAGGGSYIEVGNPEATTLSAQIPYVPLALANSLFRPFIFEARNGPMVGAAFESTLLTFTVIALIWRFRWSRVKNEVLTSPTMVFSLVFLVTFGVAVGLATTNLGTLSRYRMPMMPFYVLAVLLLWKRLNPTARASE